VPAEGNVMCVNLWKNPATVVEALSIAHSLNHASPPDISTGQGAHEVILGNKKFGEAVTIPWAKIRDGSWMPPCAFAQSDMLRAAYHLALGAVWLPGVMALAKIPICLLGELSFLGPDRRDVMDGFRLASALTNYPSLWGHDTQSVSTIAQIPNHYLSPLHRARPGRSLRKTTDLWPRAGRLLIAERLRLNTQRLAAVRLDMKVLSNVWKSVILRDESDEHEKALVLWLNSTLGLVLFWAHRQETQGAWVEFKQSALNDMPVLDIRSLSDSQKRLLIDAYDTLSTKIMLPFPQMANDPVRRAIDMAISKALELPDLSVLRNLLGQEPVVCLRALS
jgi:hypothetical protein